MDIDVEVVPRPVLRAETEGSGGSVRDLPAGNTLELDLVGTAGGLEALRPDWDALFERAGGPGQVFQTASFIDLYARTHGLGTEHDTCADAGCECRLAILTARRSGRLVLVWPLVMRRVAGLRVLTWLGEPIAQYGDVLIDPREATLPLLQAAFAHAVETLRPDAVRLRKVRADAAVTTFLAAQGRAPISVAEAPCVTLAAGGSFFESRQSGRAKKNRRRLMRRLEEQGKVEVEQPAGTVSAPALVSAGLEFKRGWLVRRGLVSPALADRRLDVFLAAGVGDPRTGIVVLSLRLEGRPIAVAIGFRCKTKLMVHLIAHATDVERHGAGVLNLEAIFRWAEAEGLEAVDLLSPSADYKLDWADIKVPVRDYVWGITWRGSLLTRAVDRILVPGAKRLTAALPMALRRRLAACVLGQSPG
jgi:CelD/BcsL family acetyltransferase involved in cellulose biosynthesis